MKRLPVNPKIATTRDKISEKQQKIEKLNEEIKELNIELDELERGDILGRIRQLNMSPEQFAAFWNEFAPAYATSHNIEVREAKDEPTKAENKGTGKGKRKRVEPAPEKPDKEGVGANQVQILGSVASSVDKNPVDKSPVEKASVGGQKKPGANLNQTAGTSGKPDRRLKPSFGDRFEDVEQLEVF